MRLLLFTPTWEGGLAPETAASIARQEFSGELVRVVSTHNPYPVPDHRNVLAQYRLARQRVLEGGFDALLTVEHDMILPDGAAQALWDTAGDVIFGVYMFRLGSHVLNAFEYVGQRNIGESLSLHPRKAQAALKKGVVRVSGAGWGCTLIRRTVLEQIEFPGEYPENPAYDIRFAQLCVRADVTMMANFGVLCGHIQGERVLWPYSDDAVMAAPAETQRFDVKVGGDPLTFIWRVGPEPVRVRARQTLNVNVNGSSVHMESGQEYIVPSSVALDLCRAAYAEVVHVS